MPVVPNTSFNLKGEPIVNTQGDAFNTFTKREMDCLVLDNFLRNHPRSRGHGSVMKHLLGFNPAYAAPKGSGTFKLGHCRTVVVLGTVARVLHDRQSLRICVARVRQA